MLAILSWPQCASLCMDANFLIYTLHYISARESYKMLRYIDGLMQKRSNFIVLAMELRLFWINSLRPSDAYMRQ